MKLGLSSYTFTWAVGVPGCVPQNPWTAYDIIDKASSTGIEVVQIADNIPLESYTDDELEKIKLYAAGKNVSIEMGGRGLSPEHTMQCLIAAGKLGSPILRMVIDGKDFEPCIDTVISIMRELLPEFEKRNIKLAIENHDRFRAREFEKIVCSSGSPFTGICLDSVNSMGAGEGFETVAAILLPYTINLHVKDFSIRRVSHKMGLIIEGTPAGRGMLNIRELIEKLASAGTCNSAILEQWTPPERDIIDTVRKEELWAKESIYYLKGLFKDII